MPRQRLGTSYRIAVGALRPTMRLLHPHDWRGAEHLPDERRVPGLLQPHLRLRPGRAGALPLRQRSPAVLPGQGRAVHRPGRRAGDPRAPARSRSSATARTPSRRSRPRSRRCGPGKCVAIYPEATVTRDPDLWPMTGKTGAARVALETGCPLIPVAQWGAQALLPYHSFVPRLFPRKPMQVLAGPPVDLDDLRGRPIDVTVLREATARIIADITALLAQLRVGETPPADAVRPAQHAGQGLVTRTAVLGPAAGVRRSPRCWPTRAPTSPCGAVAAELADQIQREPRQPAVPAGHRSAAVDPGHERRREGAGRAPRSSCWPCRRRACARSWASSAPFLPGGAVVVSLMKGVELGTTRRMSEVIIEVTGVDAGQVAVLSGPNLAREIALCEPAASVVACVDRAVAERVSDLCATSYFRPYTNVDVVGTELGGAVKNVIAIAVGMADGMGLGDNAKASIITRGLAETARLGAALGADPLTFLGLAGIGDLVATCMSPLSRNRTFGEGLGRGLTVEEVVGRDPDDGRGREVLRVDAGPGPAPRRRRADHRERRRGRARRRVTGRDRPAAAVPSAEGGGGVSDAGDDGPDPGRGRLRRPVQRACGELQHRGERPARPGPRPVRRGADRHRPRRPLGAGRRRPGAARAAPGPAARGQLRRPRRAGADQHVGPQPHGARAGRGAALPRRGRRRPAVAARAVRRGRHAAGTARAHRRALRRVRGLRVGRGDGQAVHEGPAGRGRAARSGRTSSSATPSGSATRRPAPSRSPRSGWPVFVKPARAGSSMGISKVHGPDELAAAVEAAREHDPKVVVEAAVVGPRDRVRRAGVARRRPPETAPLGEIEVLGDSHEFYDFDAKYLDEEHLRLTCPADLPDDVAARDRRLCGAVVPGAGLRGAGPGRLLPDRARATSIVNEVNTMPGFTPVSMFPLMWATAGLDYPRLVDRLLQLALHRRTGLR